MKRFCKQIADYMGVLVLLSAIVALVFPEVIGQVKPTVINPLLGIIMFGMGLTLNANDFHIVFSRPKDIIIGCLAQFTIMPLLAWLLAQFFQLDEALTIGVILVGCCPGGTASNVITYLAKGDLALSVGMTGVSTLLAPVLTPLLVWLTAGETVDVNIIGMLLSILWVVILPIISGLVVKQLWPRHTAEATAYLPALSSIAICAIVLIVIAANAGKLILAGMAVSAVCSAFSNFILYLAHNKNATQEVVNWTMGTLANTSWTEIRIILPIMVPAMATMGIMAVIGSWNNYLTPLMLFTDPVLKTLPMMVQELRGDIYRTEYGSIYLGLTLTAAPLLIVYFAFSKYIIAGVALGGVKE